MTTLLDNATTCIGVAGITAAYLAVLFAAGWLIGTAVAQLCLNSVA